MALIFDKYQPFRAFNNVAPRNEAFAELLTERRYHRLYIKVAGTLAAQGTQGQPGYIAAGTPITDAAQAIAKLSLEVNSKDRRRLTPAQLRQLNACNGAMYNGDDLTVLVLHLREDWLWNHAAADYLSLGFVGLLRLLVKAQLFDETKLQTVQLSGWYEADDGYDINPVTGLGVGPMPLGRIKQTAEDRFQVSGDTVKLPAIAWKGVVRRLHLFSPNIKKVKIEVGSRVLHEFTKDEQEKILKMNELVPNPDVFVVPFDATQRAFDGIDAGSLRDAEVTVEFTTGTGASFDMVQEYIDIVV